MKTINLTRLENKSWNEITNAAGEVKELWESVSKKHNREELIGQRTTCENMIDGLLVDLRKNTKGEAAENVRKAYNLISEFIEAVAKAKHDFLESEEGKALTAKLKADTEEFYKQYAALENETAKYINAKLANFKVVSFMINSYDARVELSQAGADRVKEFDIIYHYAEFGCRPNNRIVTDNIEYSFGGVRSKFSADGDDYSFVIAIGLFLNDKNLQAQITDILKQSCEKADAIRAEYREIKKAHDEKVTF